MSAILARGLAWLREVWRNDWVATGVPVALLCALAFTAAYWFVEPAPPQRVRLAAPDEAGARFFARKYKEILARDGVAVEVVETPGSAGAVELLAKDDVEAALAQGGTLAPSGPGTEDDEEIYSLGQLTYAPLWILYRGEPITDLRDLKGKKVSIGRPKSGTHTLAQQLLEAAGAAQPPTEVLTLERDKAVQALAAGELDAAIFLAPAESPAIQKAVALPGVRVLDLERAEAWTRRFRFLHRLVLPHGVLDLKADVPPRDITLVAPTTNLLANASLHPAIAYLLLRAATEVHASAGLLDGHGEFPHAGETGFPLSEEAKRWYKNGPPLTQRFFPYWLANLIDRLWVMLVPLLAVVLPLGRAVPSLFQWRIRSSVFRWYATLKQIEIDLEKAQDRPALDAMLVRLDEIEKAVNNISAPLAYQENLYFFREHVDVVRRRLLRRIQDRQPTALLAAAP